MSEIAKGRKVKVEIGYTEGPAKVVSAVSLDEPGEVTSNAHALVDGSVGFFDGVVGMDEIAGQAARIANGATNTFELEGIDTTDYSAWVSGGFVPITAWATLSQSTEYNLGGQGGTTEDSTVLLDSKDKNEMITQGVESVSINVRALTEDNLAMAKIRQVAKKVGYLVFRITLHDGAQRIFRGQPSLPGEALATKGLGTGSLTVAVKGDILYLPALA